MCYCLRIVPIENKPSGSVRNSEKLKANKFSVKCFNCGKNGHISRFYKSKRIQNESSDVDNAMIVIAFNVELMDTNKTMDSSAIKHMCTERKAFTNLDKDKQSTIYTAMKYFTKSIGVAEIILKSYPARLNKHEKKFSETEVVRTLCVPDLRNNLLSVTKITNNGYPVTFRKHHAMLNRSDGSVALTTKKCNNLYIINDKQE